MYMAFCDAGHPVGLEYATQPSPSRRFCAKCGKPAIVQCPGCSQGFRIAHSRPQALVEHGFALKAISTQRPSYCGSCGHELPWTAAAREALLGAAEVAELSTADVKELDRISRDLFEETPATPTATLKLNRILAPLVGDARAAIVSIMMTYGIEYVKARMQG